MPRPSIVPELLRSLVPYLEAKRLGFAETGTKTLPATVDGKINVAAIVEELGWPSKWRQHMWKPELKELLDEAAELQGIGKIGMRDEDDDDKAVRDMLAAANARAAEYQAKLAEREALILRLRRELAGEREKTALMVETGILLRRGG